MTVSVPSASDVRNIIDTTLTDPQVSAVIGDAALMVEACVTGLDVARQAAIVKYVAAHMITISGKGGQAARLTSKRLGDASKTYSQAQMGQNLAGTTYGQSAIALDPGGCLPRIGLATLTFSLLSDPYDTNGGAW